MSGWHRKSLTGFKTNNSTIYFQLQLFLYLYEILSLNATIFPHSWPSVRKKHMRLPVNNKFPFIRPTKLLIATYINNFNGARITKLVYLSNAQYKSKSIQPYSMRAESLPFFVLKARNERATRLYMSDLPTSNNVRKSSALLDFQHCGLLVCRKPTSDCAGK